MPDAAVAQRLTASVRGLQVYGCIIVSRSSGKFCAHTRVVPWRFIRYRFLSLSLDLAQRVYACCHSSFAVACSILGRIISSIVCAEPPRLEILFDELLGCCRVELPIRVLVAMAHQGLLTYDSFVP